ncbi:hypothetical protein T439DRAFT_363299 [Meredithblackwellia eburnea MCA 4105]
MGKLKRQPHPLVSAPLQNPALGTVAALVPASPRPVRELQRAWTGISAEGESFNQNTSPPTFPWAVPSSQPFTLPPTHSPQPGSTPDEGPLQRSSFIPSHPYAKPVAPFNLKTQKHHKYFTPYSSTPASPPRSRSASSPRSPSPVQVQEFGLAISSSPRPSSLPPPPSTSHHQDPYGGMDDSSSILVEQVATPIAVGYAGGSMDSTTDRDEGRPLSDSAGSVTSNPTTWESATQTSTAPSSLSHSLSHGQLRGPRTTRSTRGERGTAAAGPGQASSSSAREREGERGHFRADSARGVLQEMMEDLEPEQQQNEQKPHSSRQPKTTKPTKPTPPPVPSSSSRAPPKASQGISSGRESPFPFSNIVESRGAKLGLKNAESFGATPLVTPLFPATTTNSATGRRYHFEPKPIFSPVRAQPASGWDSDASDDDDDHDEEQVKQSGLGGGKKSLRWGRRRKKSNKPAKDREKDREKTIQRFRESEIKLPEVSKLLADAPRFSVGCMLEEVGKVHEEGLDEEEQEYLKDPNRDQQPNREAAPSRTKDVTNLTSEVRNLLEQTKSSPPPQESRKKSRGILGLFKKGPPIYKVPLADPATSSNGSSSNTQSQPNRLRKTRRPSQPEPVREMFGRPGTPEPARPPASMNRRRTSSLPSLPSPSALFTPGSNPFSPSPSPTPTPFSPTSVMTISSSASHLAGLLSLPSDRRPRSPKDERKGEREVKATRIANWLEEIAPENSKTGETLLLSSKSAGLHSTPAAVVKKATTPVLVVPEEDVTVATFATRDQPPPLGVETDFTPPRPLFFGAGPRHSPSSSLVPVSPSGSGTVIRRDGPMRFGSDIVSLDLPRTPSPPPLGGQRGRISPFPPSPTAPQDSLTSPFPNNITTPPPRPQVQPAKPQKPTRAPLPLVPAQPTAVKVRAPTIRRGASFDSLVDPRAPSVSVPAPVPSREVSIQTPLSPSASTAFGSHSSSVTQFTLGSSGDENLFFAPPTQPNGRMTPRDPKLSNTNNTRIPPPPSPSSEVAVTAQAQVAVRRSGSLVRNPSLTRKGSQSQKKGREVEPVPMSEVELGKEGERERKSREVYRPRLQPGEATALRNRLMMGAGGG